jgi:hypothetical protein
MKYSTLVALLATSSAVSLSTSTVQNPHLEATYILQDAVGMIDGLAITERTAESKTNTDYVKELDRKLKVLNDERKHVLDGEDQAKVMIPGATAATPAPVPV